MKRNKNNDSKIIELRPKNKFWRNLKIILTAIAIVCAGTLLYALRNDLSLSGIKRLASYLDFAGKSLSESNLYVNLTRGENANAVVKPFRKGLAIASGDSVKYIDGNADTIIDQYAVFASPDILTADKMFMAYDRGGTTYVTANNAAVLKSGNTDYAIISAALNNKGYFAFVTDYDGYRGAAHFYDNKQNFIGTWLSSAYYISDIAISPSGRYAAVSCLSENEGDFQSSVTVIDCEKINSASEDDINNAYKAIHISGAYILSMTFLNDNLIYVVNQDGVQLWSVNGENIGGESFDGGVCAFSASEGHCPIIAVNNYNDGGIDLNAFGNDGKVSGSFHLSQGIDSINKNGKYTAVMSGDEIYLFNDRLQEIVEPVKISEAKELSVSADGNIVVTYANRAEVLNVK